MNAKNPSTTLAESDPESPALTCSTCQACCCKLEVILMGEDDVPRHLTRQDQWGGEVMRRLDDGWCIALNRDTQLCGIYERRPGVCRDYLTGGTECVEERSHLDASGAPRVVYRLHAR
jgi:Fe-S-cluster containining protein